MPSRPQQFGPQAKYTDLYHCGPTEVDPCPDYDTLAHLGLTSFFCWGVYVRINSASQLREAVSARSVP